MITYTIGYFTSTITQDCGTVFYENITITTLMEWEKTITCMPPQWIN